MKLESVKKIGDADVVVGVQKAGGEEGPLTFSRIQDPNITHPLRQTDIVGRKGTLGQKDVAGKLMASLPNNSPTELSLAVACKKGIAVDLTSREGNSLQLG